MPNTSKVTKSHITILNSHTSLEISKNSKELNKIMDSLVKEVWIGDDQIGYMVAKIDVSSLDEIWPHYEKLYAAIGSAKYKLDGEINDLYDLKLARNDKDFQVFLSKL